MKPDYREPESPDAAWLDQHAAERRSQWESDRRAMDLLRAQERERLPLHRRLHDVLATSAVFPTTPAGRVASASPSAIADAGPPSADPYALGGLHRNEVERHIDMIRRHIAALEAAVDSHRFGGSRRHTSSLLGDEKDKLILSDYEGLSPEAVSELDPDLGDAIVIRRVRMEAGRHPETGLRDERPKRRG